MPKIGELSVVVNQVDGTQQQELLMLQEELLLVDLVLTVSLVLLQTGYNIFRWKARGMHQILVI